MDAHNLTDPLARAQRLADAYEYEALHDFLAENLPEQIPDDAQGAQARAGLLVLRAQTHLTLGRWDEAANDARQVLALATRLTDRSFLVTALLVMGTLLKNRGELNEALDSFQHALEVGQAVRDALGCGEAHLNLAAIYSKLGQGKESNDQLAHAHALTNSAPDSRRGRRLRCSILVQEAIEAMRKKTPEEVSSLCKQALAGLSDDPYAPEAAEAFRFLGVIASRQLQHREALLHLTTALNIYKKCSHIFGQAKIYNSIGQTLLNLSRGSEAAHFMEKAEALCNQVGALAEAATMYGKLGQVHLQQEDYAKAIDYFQKDLQISRKMSGKRAMAYVHRNLGQAYTQAENYTEAITHFKESLQLFQALEDEVSAGQIYMELCRYYLKQRLYERARGMLQWGSSILVKYKQPTELAHIALVSGILLHGENKLGEAEQKLREANEFYSFREPTERHVETIYHYGMLLVDLGKRDKAVERLLESMQMARSLGLSHHAKRCFKALESIDEIGLIKSLVDAG